MSDTISKRVPKQWLGAFKCGHRKAVREYIDEELSIQMLKRWEKNNRDKEAIKILDYLTKFNNEYHKNVVKKGDKKALHSTPELKKKCYKNQNAMNRDLMNKYRTNQSETELLEASNTEWTDEYIVETLDLQFEKNESNEN